MKMLFVTRRRMILDFDTDNEAVHTAILLRICAYWELLPTALLPKALVDAVTDVFDDKADVEIELWTRTRVDGWNARMDKMAMVLDFGTAYLVDTAAKDIVMPTLLLSGEKVLSFPQSFERVQRITDTIVKIARLTREIRDKFRKLEQQ